MDKKYVFFLHNKILKVYIWFLNDWQLYSKKEIKADEEIDPYISRVSKELFNSAHITNILSKYFLKVFKANFDVSELEINKGIIVQRKKGSYFFTYIPLTRIPMSALN